LDKGVIKEMGTHNQLMNLQGHYYNLHKMQFEMQESEMGSEVGTTGRTGQ
jgi:ATP-binding cassette subfamily B protein